MADFRILNCRNKIARCKSRLSLIAYDSLIMHFFLFCFMLQDHIFLVQSVFWNELMSYVQNEKF